MPFVYRSDSIAARLRSTPAETPAASRLGQASRREMEQASRQSAKLAALAILRPTPSVRTTGIMLIWAASQLVNTDRLNNSTSYFTDASYDELVFVLYFSLC